MRREFGQNAFKFAEFASKPENVERLSELIPALAEPGSYFPDVIGRLGDIADVLQERGDGAPVVDAPVLDDPAASENIIKRI